MHSDCMTESNFEPSVIIIILVPANVMPQLHEFRWPD